MTTPARQVDFYFDYISHNAYLAWHQLPAMVARHGYQLRAVPVLFAGFLKTYGQLGPAEIAPKLHWMNRDNLRKASLLGVPFNAPFKHPFNPLFALRLTAQDMSESQRHALTGRLLRGVWVDALDPEDPAAVADYLALHEGSSAEFLAGASTPAAKARLRANTEEAIARGAFGVPTMLVGDAVFWGNDDLPMLERHLAGADPLTQAALAEFEQGWVDARARGRHRQRD